MYFLSKGNHESEESQVVLVPEGKIIISLHAASLNVNKV